MANAGQDLTLPLTTTNWE